MKWYINFWNGTRGHHLHGTWYIWDVLQLYLTNSISFHLKTVGGNGNTFMWKWPEQYTGRGVEYRRNSELILRLTSDLKVSFDAVIMSHIWLLYN